ncbi:hypothetical protein ACFC0S_16460 [Streptomyces sp. NPDC056084]|uniref:hypothetical protein n=1 Tax=unclassified Streptomyces TaxID=2593676 RepID=UPI0035DB7C4F
MTTLHEPTRNQALDQLVAAALHQARADWEHLTTAQQQLLRTFATARRRNRRTAGLSSVPASLREGLSLFNVATARFNTNLGALAERWASVDLPRAYRLGAEDALTHAVLARGGHRPAFAWTATHQHALSTLTTAFYPVLIRRVSDTVRRSQAFARAIATAARAAEPPTAAELAALHPLDTVTYARGAQHPVASWARTALAAQGISAANTGALTATTADLDAQWVQVIDGPECGWTSHDELDRAHDTLRSADEAASYPIAHPGCLRRFIPRPDLNTATIEEGQPA